jgi:hypothetical protein
LARPSQARATGCPTPAWNIAGDYLVINIDFFYSHNRSANLRVVALT